MHFHCKREQEINTDPKYIKRAVFTFDLKPWQNCLFGSSLIRPRGWESGALRCFQSLVVRPGECDSAWLHMTWQRQMSES